MKILPVVAALLFTYQTTAQELKELVAAGDVAAVEQTLAQGDVVSAEQARLLIVAVQAQQKDMLAMLLERGFNANATTADQQRATATMYAAYANAPDMLAVLYEHGADLDQVDAIGDPAINWAVYGGMTEAVDWLLGKDVRIDQVGHGDAISIAMRRGHQEILGKLCEIASCNEQLSRPTQQLVQAIDQGNMLFFSQNLTPKAASSLDQTGRPLLHRAARQGRSAMVALMLDKGADPNLRDPIGFTPIMEAAREAQTATVRQLLDYGASVSAIASESALRFQVMHLAAVGGDPEIIDTLHKAGASLDPVDTDNSTPAMWALGEGQQDAMSKLLELGADIHHENRYGMSIAKVQQRSQSK